MDGRYGRAGTMAVLYWSLRLAEAGFGLTQIVRHHKKQPRVHVASA